MEPQQLGAGTPDGCVLVVKALRLWQHNAERENRRAEQQGDECDPHTLLALDLENAYGRALRSGMLQGMSTAQTGLYPLLAAQWGGGPSTM